MYFGYTTAYFSDNPFQVDYKVVQSYSGGLQRSPVCFNRNALHALSGIQPQKSTNRRLTNLPFSCPHKIGIVCFRRVVSSNIRGHDHTIYPKSLYTRSNGN